MNPNIFNDYKKTGEAKNINTYILKHSGHQLMIENSKDFGNLIGFLIQKTKNENKNNYKIIEESIKKNIELTYHDQVWRNKLASLCLSQPYIKPLLKTPFLLP